MHQQHAVTVEGFVHHVTADQDHQAGVRQVAKERPEVTAQDRIQPDSGFVQDQQARRSKEGDSQGHAAALTAAEPTDPNAAVRRQIHLFDDPLDGFNIGTNNGGKVAEVVGHTEIVVHARCLRDVTDHAPGGAGTGRLAKDCRTAAMDALYAGEGTHERGLAGARGAEQARDFACGQVKVEVMQDPPVAPPYREPCNAYRWHAATLSPMLAAVNQLIRSSRRWPLFLLLVTIMLTATSCMRPGVAVPFPDDARVLHGAWEMKLERSSEGGSVIADPPVEAPGTASLDLIAKLPPGGGSHSHYEFSGSVTMPPGLGWPGDLYIEGHVDAGGIHKYTPAGLGPQMTAPRWRLNAQLYDPADGDRLVFQVGDYAGDGVARGEYGILLVGVDSRVAYEAILRQADGD